MVSFCTVSILKYSSQYSVSNIIWARGLAPKSVLLVLPLREPDMESESRPRGWVVPFVHLPEGFEFLVEYLTKVHCHRLVNLLPQMGTEDLDKRDLQCRNLTVKEDTRQIKLHLETDVDVGSVDSR